MTNEERYDNIRRMGEILSQVEQTLTKAEALLEEWKALQPDFEALVALSGGKITSIVMTEKSLMKYLNGYLLRMPSLMLLELSSI